MAEVKEAKPVQAKRSPVKADARPDAKSKSIAQLVTPTDLGDEARKEIAKQLTVLLADVFALYIKTKNFHWHVSGPHFRDYHLMLEEQATAVYEITDVIAERARKLGGTTLRSTGQIAQLQRLKNNDADFVSAPDMLSELRNDNQELVKYLREVHDLCDDHEDVATASLIEEWIDQAEERIWFLFEASR
ncbi:Dps family protein [Chitinasiproducens palmae]|uniref:Starvation-inducible DNA-binding protein n=1 Tax=Chitinasiproducens palmae TaxID=1770053 RepID=A0A1H2PRN2_9BURK|nr:DNA starvation/stationary phase protection protein [Chitinasiproducens palmae]SDV49113.1 starvation-inducible DNA-binding protein [Chitinasiproducens palmae]